MLDLEVQKSELGWHGYKITGLGKDAEEKASPDAFLEMKPVLARSTEVHGVGVRRRQWRASPLQEAERGPYPIWKRFVLHSPVEVAAVARALLPDIAPAAQGYGMGVRESPSGRVGKMPWQAMGGDPKKRSFPASPTTPISFH